MTTETTEPAALALGRRMRHLLYGQLISRALSAVASAGVPEVMDSEGPSTAENIARSTGLHPGALRRTLRALSAFDVIEEFSDGRFALTELGRTLCPGTVGSALPTAVLVGDAVGAAWTHFGETLRTGVPAFDTVHGSTFFEFSDTRPELLKTFQASQVAGLELDLAAILRSMPTGIGTIVDVGGGDGALLAAVLGDQPEAHGILLEVPALAPLAHQRLTAAEVIHRCSVVTGDFRQAVPAGGDVYLLRQILHDWDDETCVSILRHCRRAMRDDAVLVLIDILVGAPDSSDDKDPDPMSAAMDLYMLTIFTGRERTRPEIDSLLARADLRLESVDVISGSMAIVRAAPRESPNSGRGQDTAWTGGGVQVPSRASAAGA